MELSFDPTVIAYLRAAADTTAEQEETAEIIVPDSWPDAACVCSCFAEAMLRGKDCREGSVVVSGGIKAGIYYQPETEDAPRILECYIPFTVKVDQPALTDHSQVICTCNVRNVDAKPVNSRKIRLRTEIGCSIQAWNPAEDTLYAAAQLPKNLQVRTSDYALQLPLETAEKSFAVSDTPELPEGRPSIAALCKCLCTPMITERKLIGSKAVFKGVLRCNMVYTDTEQRLHRWETDLPFSQYCELNGDYDDEQALIIPAITGYDVQTESDRRIALTANLLAQCLITGTRSVTMTEDAYATKGILEPVWKAYDFSPLIDHCHTNIPLRHQAATDLTQVLDWDLYTESIQTVQENDRVLLRTPIRLRVTGYDKDGALRSETVTTTGEAAFPLAGHASCRLQTDGLSVNICESGGQLLADGEVCLSVWFFADQTLQTLCGGEIVPSQTPRLPELLVRSVERNSRLWDIAKQYGSTVSSIQAANDLQGATVPQTDLLLIPIG